ELEAAGARTPSRSPVRPAVVVTAAAAEVRAGVDDAAWATTLSAAAKALQLSSVPHLLPCREKERGQITAFLRTSLAKGGLGSALYISGMPGTGKTSLVMEIIRTLSAEAEAGTLPAFKFVELNAMKLATPHDAYSQLASELLGVYAAATRAASLLDTHFRTANKQRLATVLLVDELDFLMTRQQTVIYNLFNWPQYANSKLIIVSLANTMDLPERLLPKVASRLSPLRLVFQPYTREQLVTIMAARLTDSKTQATFEEDAVRLAAAKVAGTSGDVRRSLAICRRAVELLQADGGRGKVTPSHVHRASRDLLGSLIVSAVASCRPWEQNLLIAVALQQRATGCHVLSLVEVWERLSSLLSSQSFHKPAHRRAGVTHATSSAASLLTPPSCFSPIPTLAECVSVAASLHRLRLLFLEPVKSTPWPNVRLAIGVSDVATALPDNELAQRVLA
ncbi:AAA family ATPase, partial [archaeon]